MAVGRVRFGSRGLTAAAAITLLAGCSAQANDDLLASDLIYRDQRDGWTRTIKIDPWLSHRPDLVRKVREERIPNMQSEGQECSTLSGEGCSEASTFELHYDGKRFVSLLETTEIFGGGAHGLGTLRDHLYDLETGKELRFGDLFTSWSKVRPLIQREFCEQIRGNYENLSKCPDVQKQAIVLAESDGPRASGFVIKTQDYELGSYAAGRGTFSVDVLPAIFALIRDEYKSQFKIPSYLTSDAEAPSDPEPPTSEPETSLAVAGPRGTGSCKVGDPLQFAGGWAIGAGGRTFLDNPVVDFEDFLANNELNRVRFAEEDPLKFDYRGGCTGVSHLDPMQVYLAEPYGGTIRGGKFQLVAAQGITENGRKRACLIVVKSQDVICHKSRGAAP